MTEHITLTKEELNEIIESALKRCSHNQPSGATLEMFDRLNRAIFGVDGDEEHKGMLKKTDEMYNVFVVGRSGTTLIKYVGAVILGALGIVSAIKGIFFWK